MRRRTFGIGVVLAAGAGALVIWRSDLGEDLDWETIEKPGRIIDIDGYGVHYVSEGEGQAIVLIHGFGGSIFSYCELIPQLARTHRVVAGGLKGCGYSERSAGAGLSHSDQVVMLRNLLDRLGIERAVFVGHSLGGAIAQRFAASHPEMVHALVLAASATGDERLAQHLARGIPQGFADMLEGLTTAVSSVLQRSTRLSEAVGRCSHMRLVSRRLLRLWSYDLSAIGADVWTGYERPMRLRGTLAATMRAVRDTARDVPLDRTRITMPVLLLYAADDRTTPPTVAQTLRQRLPQARLIVIERAAHLLLEERPEECVRAIEDFLRDAAEAPPRVSGDV